MDVVVVARKMQTRLSALGQKQTFAVQKSVSALLPKADMCGALIHVRFVPIAIEFGCLFHTQIARVGALQHSIYNASWSLWTRP
jgi:hypothetical protein